MKRILIVCLAVWSFGCEAVDQGPPQISVDILPVILPVMEYSPDFSGRTFDLQVRNTGGGTLRFDHVRLKGDPRCAFDFDGPDEVELGPNESAFIRGAYDPPGTGDDAMMIEIESNSTEEAELVIPICGRAIGQEPTADDFIAECGPVDLSAGECDLPEYVDDLLE